MKNKKIISLLVCFFVLMGLLFWSNPLRCNNFTEKNIIVKQGMSSYQVAGLLANEKIIKSKKYFLILLRLKGGNKKIKAGTYNFNSNMSVNEIIDLLIKGKVVHSRVTIPEGLTVNQIGQLLEKNIPVSADKFVEIVNKKKLEGYLFPDTYFILPEMTEEEIINMMTSQFYKVFTPELKIKAEELNFSVDNIVILASLIEKEARKEEERNLISAVFHNRLKKYWRLESDPTVRYALAKWNETVTYKDLEVDSPYNTYKYYGLPPGPICNPGMASLKAALYPADSDLMFFVATGDGGHEFSKDYKEHLLKKKRISMMKK